MLILPPAATLHLGQQATRLTVAGVIYKRDGSAIRCTQHDDDLPIETGDLAGSYLSVAAITASDIKQSSDLSVDNMEVEGILDDGFIMTGFNVVDIEAGLFSGAPFETFLCQWDDPEAWQRIIRRGYLGEISRTAEGQFQAEWRGILQYLQQQCGRTYSENCDVVRFGDARCGVDVAGMAASGEVTAVTSKRRFDSTLTGVSSPGPAGGFSLGELIFTSGANVGFLKQVKQDAAAGTLGEFELWESLPYPIQLGDTFTVTPGCDRRFETCQGYANYKRFKGHGRWAPGTPNIIRAP